MAGFVVCKNDNDFVVATCSSLVNTYYGNGYFNDNNSQILVVDHPFGKIVVVCSRIVRIKELMDAYKTKLFKKNKHIDYNYLKYEFYPLLIDLLGKNSNLEITDKENGLDNCKTDILIIAESKAFLVRPDGYVKEQDMIGSTSTLEAVLFSMKEDTLVQDEKFLTKVIMFDHLMRRDFIYGIEVLSTKDYKIHFIPVLREELLNDSNCSI